jgi:RecB family exonuclease
VLRGRIDAIYRTPDVELVDWKTGRLLDQTEGGLDQLAIYALALRELGQLPRDRCAVAYCYLGGEEPLIEARELGPADLEQQRGLLERTLAALDRGEYQRACGRPDCETCRRGLGPPPRPPA